MLAHAAGCGACFGKGPFGSIATSWPRRVSLKFHSSETTIAAAEALRQPYNEQFCEVLATDTMDSFDLAAFFGLVLVEDEWIVGWIDPSDLTRHLWNLHLMPDQVYPPGHEPAPVD